MTSTAIVERDEQHEMLRAQVRERSMAPLEGEKRLMLAVLERAVDDFQIYANVPTGRGRWLFRKVAAWFDSSETGPFDFEGICQATGLDPGFIRTGLRRWRAMHGDPSRHRRMRRTLMSVAALVVLIIQNVPARAEIYEWVDNEHHRHFVTSLDHVPPGARAKARLLAQGEPPHGGGEATTAVVGAAGPDTAQAPAAPTGEVAPDAFASGWDAGFRLGWNEGYRAAKDEEPICPTEPDVVVLESPVVVSVPLYDPTGAYYVSPYQGTVTVPFDAGRSRGLTRRQQIQEQRRIERGW